MEREFEYDFERLLELLESRNYRELKAALADENEVDIADFIERLPQEKATGLLPHASQGAGGRSVFQSSYGDTAGDHRFHHG